jgi:predicted dinucleotide-binding enzyme
MNISIIGAGNIGATLARKLAAAGHTIRLANSRGPDSIQTLAREVGATAVTREDAVQDAEVIILAIPFDKHPALASLLNAAPADAIIIDTSNYYPFRDGDIAALQQGQTESQWASEQLHRPVIKAWNAVLAATLAEKGQPAGQPDRLAIPVAGDDAQAKAVAMTLVDVTGFDAVDAGSLSDSWRQQPGTPAYCTELSQPALISALQAADRHRAPHNRDALINEFMSAGELTHAAIVARNRAVTA